MNEIVQIIRLLRPYWLYIAQSLLVGVFVLLLQIPGPYFTKILIDDVYPHKDWSLLAFALLLGAVVSTGLGGVSFLSSYFGQCVGVRLGFDFQSIFYRHVQSLDFSFFDQRETGEILSRFRDMRSSISSVIRIINTFIMNSLQLLIFPPILFYINWKLALICLAVLPFDTLLVVITRKYMRRFSEKIAERSAELSAKNYESLNGIRTVQALGLEARFYEKLENLFTVVADLRVRSALFSGGSGFVGGLINTSGTLAYSWYGWTQVLSGNLSLGSFMAFTAYVGFLYGPIRNLIELIRSIELTLVHINRFFEIYHIRPAIQDDPKAPPLTITAGQVEFNDLSFSYDGQHTVLRRINLVIEAGTTAALVGRSGSGKSTLAKLIPRFYDPIEGRVAIDGQDIRAFRLQSLRRQIGFALQGSTLFQGSIKENLSFDQNISHRTIEEAARAAYIHDFISTLPQGYDTLVGEQGVNFSEGQRQRIALARVLLMDTPILILDEPTSALDAESEYHIHEALKTVQEGRTTIIVAHRLSTIRAANQIVVLENGSVAEQGTHDCLLNTGGAYAGLFDKMARI